MLQDAPMPTREPDRVPIFYSAAVYPGVGQLVQRRKAAAVVYAVCFTFFLAIFLAVAVRYFREILSVLQAWWNNHAYDLEAHRPSMKPLAAPGLVTLAIYLANVFDTTVAYLKQKRSWAQRSEPPPLEPSR